MQERTPEAIREGEAVANRVRQGNVLSAPVPRDAPAWMQKFKVIFIEAFPGDGEEEGVLVFMDEALHEYIEGAWRRVK